MELMFGEYLRKHRVEAGLSLRDVADALGVSYVFVGDVERGKRKSLAPSHWERLVALMPAMTLDDLEEAATNSELVISPAQLSGEVRAAALTLARRLSANDVSQEQAEKILSVFRRKE